MRVVLFVVLSLILAPAATADQRDARLDALFEKLSGTAAEGDSDAIEREIWSIWSTSEDPETNRLMARGVAAMHSGFYDEALERFEDVVRREPAFAEGWNKRATVLFILGRYRASIADIKRTLALEERHFGALSGLGMCYDALDDKEGALAAYRLAIETNPHLASIRRRIERLEQELRGKAI